MAEAKRILIIEDEPDIVRGLTDALDFEGFDVVSASSGAEGLERARETDPHCVLLDLMLPDENGYHVCEQLRAEHPVVPIVMLTAKAQESDKIRGFDVGADDYVTKPFSIAELIARINAIFRRQERLALHEDTFNVGSWVIDARKHTMSRGRNTQRLTFYELELLKLLRERAEQPVSRDQILEKIWGVEASASNRTVDNFVAKLRRKLEDDQKNPRHILTVYGFGYKLVP